MLRRTDGDALSAKNLQCKTDDDSGRSGEPGGKGALMRALCDLGHLGTTSGLQ